MDEVDVEIIGDEEVEEAVAIALDEGAAGGVVDAGLEESGFLRDIDEGAVAVVVVETILAIAGDEDVVEAIVVVVADADAHGPDSVAEASFFGDVGKGAVAIIFVEAITGTNRNAF